MRLQNLVLILKLFMSVPHSRFHTVNPANASMLELFFFFAHTVRHNSDMFRSVERIGLKRRLCYV
jgi:hypothetical protein